MMDPKAKREIVRQYEDKEYQVKELMERAEGQEDAGMALAFITRNEAEQAEQELFKFITDNGISFQCEAPFIYIRE